MAARGAGRVGVAVVGAFARPGNRFWPALHRGGWTPRQLDPAEQGELLTYGLGIAAYRTASGHRGAVVGPQPEAIDPTRVWVLPNPSGLNAHYTLPRVAQSFAELRAAAG